MANTCIGKLRIVSKDKNVFKRIEAIGKGEDKEFFLSRCWEMDAEDCIQEENGFFYQTFYVEGAWNCSRFFTEAEDKGIRRDDDPNGAYQTNLVELAKKLDFAAELYADETGVGFCEHCIVNHNGRYFEEVGDCYPCDSEEDCEEYEYTLETWMNFMSAEKLFNLSTF